MDKVYNDPNNKFDSFSTHVKQMKIQNAQNVEAIKREAWRLPGKVEVNPRAQCNALTSEKEKGVEKVSDLKKDVEERGEHIKNHVGKESYDQEEMNYMGFQNIWFNPNFMNIPQEFTRKSYVQNPGSCYF